MASSPHLQPFVEALQHLGVLFARLASEQSTVHARYSKQELLTIAMLGVQGPCKMGDIATHLGVVQSAITPLVDRLESAQIAERVRSQEDRRVWLVGLTDKGRTLYAEEAQIYEMAAATMLAPLSEAEQQTLVALLTRIGSHIANPGP